MARYRLAATRAHGRTLDLGSGVGYGASIIGTAQSVDSLIALDISTRALAFGKGSYGDMISFVTGDAGALPFARDSLDSVVCFEMIEHVTDAEIVLKEIARVLRPDGLLIVSTPNKWATSPLYRRPINPYHVVEWYPSGFRKRVSRYFEVEEVLGQSWHPVGMMRQALRSNMRTRVKETLDRLRLLGVAQKLRKASGHDSMAEGASQHGSIHLDVPTQEEVLAASPRSWTNTRQEGIPLTVILIARWSESHESQQSGWDSRQR